MPKHYKLQDNSAVITQVLKVAGGVDKYKMFTEYGEQWLDSVPEGFSEVSEGDYCEVANELQVLRAPRES